MTFPVHHWVSISHSAYNLLEITSVVVEINMIGLYKTMIGRLRQLSEPRLRQQAWIENSQTPVERDILVQWVRKNKSFQEHEKLIITLYYHLPSQSKTLHYNQDTSNFIHSS